MTNLTAKQEAFALNYFTMRNATQAAIKAGYSPHLIDTHSNHLLENARIKARVAELREKAGQTEGVALLSFNEKRGIAAEIARDKSNKPHERIAGVKEDNLMEHIYEAGGNIRDVNVIFVIGKGYKEIEGKDA